MNRSTDALGQALKAYFNGNKSAEVIVHSSIDGVDTLDIAHFFRDFEGMPKLEKLALMLCKGSVLDIGAGSGCHSLILQEKDYNVSSLDVSPGAVEVMKARGLKKAFQSSIMDFRSNESFDTLLLMMNGIGVGGDLEGTQKLLEHCKTLLAPKGQILFDSSNIYQAFVNEEGAVCLDLSKGYFGTVTYQLEFELAKTEEFRWSYIDANTLKEIAEEVGYRFEIIAEVEENNEYLGQLTLD